MITEFNPDRFHNYMKEQATIIRKQSLDLNQILNIRDDFRWVLSVWELHGRKNGGDINLMSEAMFEFNLALQIAFSNYRTENKNFWKFIFGWGVSKIPQIDLNQIQR